MDKAYYSAVAEKSFLSCIILDPTILRFTDVIPGWIYTNDYVRIYEAMQKLDSEKKGVEVINLISMLPDLEEYLWELSIWLLNTANWTDYQSTIKEMFTKRQLLRLTNQVRSDLERDEAIGELQTKMKRGMEELLIAKEGENFFEVALDVIDGISEQGERICKFGYPTLDKLLGGYKEGQLLIIGARPGVGKTAFALE